jgi:hypothetical protein
MYKSIFNKLEKTAKRLAIPTLLLALYLNNNTNVQAIPLQQNAAARTVFCAFKDTAILEVMDGHNAVLPLAQYNINNRTGIVYVRQDGPVIFSPEHTLVGVGTPATEEDYVSSGSADFGIFGYMNIANRTYTIGEVPGNQVRIESSSINFTKDSTRSLTSYSCRED